jgi:hypothetical protein
MIRSIITLTHREYGPMRVSEYDEASFWTGRRQWTSDDSPELGALDDGEFEETAEQIEALLAKERAP